MANDLFSLLGGDDGNSSDRAEIDADSGVPTGVLNDSDAVRDRALRLLHKIDPQLEELIPDTIPYGPEDDPFARTREEWESLWFGTRESALRVYYTMRLEFRRAYDAALSGETTDLRPWTHFAFNCIRPLDDEPVYGLSSVRRRELGWDYSGSPDEFRIYRDGGPASQS